MKRKTTLKGIFCLLVAMLFLLQVNISIVRSDIDKFPSTSIADSKISLEFSQDNKWAKYVKTDVYENFNKYIPTPDDFGQYEGLIDDDSVLIPHHTEYEFCVVGFKTSVYVSNDKEVEIGIIGDDGVGLYCNGQFVCGRGNFEDPMSYGNLSLHEGWNKMFS